MGAVTHTRVREEISDPNLDAMSLNDWQALALYNPSPEVDSALERVDLLAAFDVPRALIEALRNDLWLAVELNGREGQCERVLARNGEQIERDLRPANGGVSLRSADIRSGLGPILDVLTVEALADPRRDWTALRQMVESRWPRRSLLCRSLVGEIGRAKAALLRELLGEVA